MSLHESLAWMIRKSLWNFLARKKYEANKPKGIDKVVRTPFQLKLIPLQQAFPDIPITGLLVAERPPQDEERPDEETKMQRLVWLAKFLSPMQPGRPGIPANPHAALEKAYTKGHRKTVARQSATLKLDSAQALQAPTLPTELHSLPDLGALAVRGPYAGYLQKVRGCRPYYEWDLRAMASYGPHSELHAPWAHVLFTLNDTTGQLRPIRIACALGRRIRPGDARWPLATRIAVCAATTHTALVRHWTWTHLVGGERFAAATRRQLPEHHWLCHLLWPHMVGTHASNRLATLGQLLPGGDFEAIYSFPYGELCRLISKTAEDFHLSAFDPATDGRRRGILGALPTPTLDNCRRLFRVIRAHVERYVRLYATDASLNDDVDVRNWLTELDRSLPNGLGLPPGPLRCTSFSRLVAQFIYMASVHHEQAGTQLWNYQLWGHTHPVRVYRDDRRLPEDVYQRLVNSNYVLNIVRAPLLGDFTGLALNEPSNPSRNERAKQIFRFFAARLQRCQQVMERSPWAPWKLYPADLEANINA